MELQFAIEFSAQRGSYNNCYKNMLLLSYDASSPLPRPVIIGLR